jgi:hypothetical protein
MLLSHCARNTCHHRQTYLQMQTCVQTAFVDSVQAIIDHVMTKHNFLARLNSLGADPFHIIALHKPEIRDGRTYA